MARPLKHSKEKQLEKDMRLSFESQLPHNFLSRIINDDIAIDMEVEIGRGEDELTAKRVWVQLKATEKQQKGIPSLSLETKYLNYWANCDLPVILIYGIKKAEKQFDFYYLFIQDFITNTLPKENTNWQKQETVTVKFLSKLEKIEETFRTIAIDGYLDIATQRLNVRNPQGATYWIDGIPKSDNQELKGLMVVALNYMEKENYTLAIEQFNHILAILNLSTIERIVILLNLGNAYFSLGKLNEAKNKFNEIIIISLDKKREKEVTYEGIAAALGNIGLVFYDQGKLEESLKCHQKALAIFQQFGFKQYEAAALGNIGNVFQVQGKLEEALKNFQTAFAIKHQFGFKQGEANDLGSIGLVFRIQGKLEEALKYHNDALAIHCEIGSKQGEAKDLGNIGTVLQIQGKLEEALKHYQASLTINHEFGFKQEEANNLGCIGLILLDQGKLEEALKYHHAALAMHQLLGYKLGEAVDLGNIGMVLMSQGKLEEALKYTNDAFVISHEFGFKEAEAIQLGNIGLIYKAQGKFKAALKHLQVALKIMNKFNLFQGKDLFEAAIKSIKNKRNEKN